MGARAHSHQPGSAASLHALARINRSLRAKRAFDVLVSALLLIALSPLLLALAAAIRLDSRGPILIFQKRHGLGMKEFRIWKFRTMTVVEEGDAAVQCAQDDPRVTRFGEFLRPTCLDELPQLVNVLKGEMSLVGPRPHPLRLDHEFGDRVVNYAGRFGVKPGMTGLAQVSGLRGAVESEEQMRKRVLADIAYIGSRTMLKDVRILLSTIPIVLAGKKTGSGHRRLSLVPRGPAGARPSYAKVAVCPKDGQPIG